MTTGTANATRTATIRTEHENPSMIAAAVAPDNTADMETRVESGAILTTVERETTGGLKSTVDDYVVNIDVAETVAGSAAQFERRTADARKNGSTEQTTDTNGYRETETQ